MRFDYLQHHLNRRQLLGTAAKAGAAGAVLGTAGGGLLASMAGAQPGAPGMVPRSRSQVDGGSYDDSFSIEGALDGTWAAETTELYGAEDERGTLNEITPEKTASALGLLAGASGVQAYNLGVLMLEGMPAFANDPPRLYSQRIRASGFQPKNPDEWFTLDPDVPDLEAWRTADLERGPLGILDPADPLGDNMVSSCEERFLHGGTYHIGTQLDHFPHFGVGDILYNGWRASEICTPKGFTNLGAEKIGAFVTRGLLLDVLGWKRSQDSEHVQVVDGHDVLLDNYRITVEDLQATMEWEGVGAIEAGDAVLINTGWWWLGENPATFDRFLAAEPGIYIAEAKFLGANRPALVGSDSWALEVLGNPDLTEWAFPVHTELLPHRGIHLGETIITHELAEAGIYEFVYSYSPQRAWGATGANVAPMALAPVAAGS
ncbi:MAG: cyclase family protein [Acidimicrobiia bacterium]|nr:cyclase family protein [Acidimicrobiia bacterium]